MSRILIPTPQEGFDPTEVAVPWKVLSDRGHEVVFATPAGQPSSADPIMVTGRGLGLLKRLLRADQNGLAAYTEMIASTEFAEPLSYEAAAGQEFDALVLPGGHAKVVKPYLESDLLQQKAAAQLAAGKPVAAICHGVLVLARATGTDGQSVLAGRTVTALVKRLEMAGFWLTRLWMGNYYRTYPEITTEDEVRGAIGPGGNFESGPGGSKRDSMSALERGFVVIDDNLITARWPGDAHRWSVAIHEMLVDRAAQQS